MIIAISGKARSGKGEFAKIAQEIHGAKVVSFAGTLKEEVIEFLGKHMVEYKMENIYGSNEDKETPFRITNSMMYDPEFPTEQFTKQYGFNGDDGETYCTFRALLQFWGTEYRRSQDDLYWVKRALEKCNPQSTTEYIELGHMGHKVSIEGRTTEHLYVIDDLRFENEAEALLKAGAALVRVERPNNPNVVTNPNHASEIGLDEWLEWRYVIENSGDLEEYHAACKFVLEDILNAKSSD